MSPITHLSEGVDEARRRLAQQARDQGVRLRLAADGRWSASSVSQPGAWHYVTGFSCDCPGFIAHSRCMHHSALLACLGWLPDNGPADPVPLDITLSTSRGHYRLAGEDDWQDPTTTILVDGVAKVRIEGDTNGVRVHWLEDGQPIDDLTDCTPILLDHHGAVAFWIESLDLSVPAQTVMERAGLRRADAYPDAA